MWILLKEGDVIREGDEDRYERPGSPFSVEEWVPVSGDLIGTTVGFGVVRRNLTGWEAVKYALETEVLGNDKEGCETTSWTWDCECAENHIKGNELEDCDCPVCGAWQSQQPDSRKAEVILKIMEEQ